jgi:hypothetical protein
MSSPTSAEDISVRPAALRALAAELSALAVELADDADLLRSTGRSFRSALGDSEGWTADLAAGGWARLQEQLADGASALAGTFDTAAAGYTAQDYSLAARIAAGTPDAAPGPR